ncbi:MAG: hypothetical protein K0S65_91 [Labilithrix sp.]|jgi:predicted RecA/RadA family phage recombinase|nr:hypothetical protein [Labilithrix sp.]
MATATKHTATQVVFANSVADGSTTIWDVPAGTEGLTLVREGDVFGVTITRAPGGSDVDTIEVGPFTITRPKLVGVGNEEATAVGDTATGIALGGTYEFDGIAVAPTTTPQATPVYADADGDLTLTATDATRVGIVNYPATYTKVAGTLPIKIGA